jgi:hypothetical protein
MTWKMPYEIDISRVHARAQWAALGKRFDPGIEDLARAQEDKRRQRQVTNEQLGGWDPEVGEAPPSQGIADQQE